MQRLSLYMAMIVCLLGAFPLTAQVADTLKNHALDSISNPLVTIDKIFIIGNKKTKEYIILRELDVAEGETYRKQKLIAALDQNENKIFNTRLFNSVDIHVLELSENKVDLLIKVTERWYLFPIPVIDFADRNLNDWIKNQNADLGRLIYGLKLYQYNVRGRNERLRLNFATGFRNSFGLQYRIPYINKKQTLGMTIGASYLENKNLAYRTLDHVQQFLESDQILQDELNLQAGFTYRKSFYNFHSLIVSYTDRRIQDTIVTLNENYFNDSSQTQRYLTLTYAFTRDRRDRANYPLSGHYGQLIFNKYGLGLTSRDVNQFDARLTLTKYWDLGKKYYLSGLIQGYTSAPVNQPYANFTGLGVGRSFVRGYEIYLIEGQHFALNKWTFKKELFNTVIYLGRQLKVEQFNTIPFAMYLKTYFDAGYVDNNLFYPQSDRLSNTLLLGYGVGLDLVTYYDLVFRAEFSFNSNGDSGFFIGIQSEF